MTIKWTLLIPPFISAISILAACTPSPTATPLLVATTTPDTRATETKIAANILATQTASAPTATKKAVQPTSVPTKPPAATPTITQFPTALAPQATASAQQCLHQSALAPSDWGVRVCDSFNRDFGLWIVGATSSAFVSGNKTIANGKYHWDLTAKTDGVSRNFPDMDPVSDFYLTAEIQITRAPSDAWGALAFRWSQASPDVPSNQYLFEVRNDRRFRAQLRNNDVYTTLVDWTQTSSLKLGAINRLTVVANGSHFDLYANEQKVGAFDDSQLSQGLAGVAIGLNRKGDHAIFDFDNFELRAPP